MRIDRVTAHAFGPFSGESLELAPGLTVVSGPNESGKSSWHAAIRAGIGGVRRGRGAGTKVEALFEERHRPWDGDGRWEVEVRLALDDGRTIEISQDLAGKVACRATDVVLGRDVSDEIMDGTPDASRWLGLDREAFAATICVGQAQIAAIAGRETAASLQEHMQRAAATRGTDATAAEAREKLDEFRRVRVGVDRQGARGPLRAAKEREEAARAALAEAKARHEAFLDASLSAEAAERAAAMQAHRVATIEAALAGRVAAEHTRRADRAGELAARHPTEPAGLADWGARADAVAGALDAWLGRPRPEPLTGTSAAELEGELAALPAPPDGDLEMHISVVETRRTLDRAEDALGSLGPRPVAPEPLGGPGEDELRALARRLRTPDPAPQPHLTAELLAAEQELASGASRGGVGWIVGAAVAGVAAIAMVVAGQLPVGAALGLLAIGLGVWAWMGRRRAPDGRDRVERARAAHVPIALARDAATAERDAAAETAAAAGLPSDAGELERRADAIAAAARATREVGAWDARRSDLEERRARAEAALAHALRARRVDADDADVHAAMASYEVACRLRAAQARRAGDRVALERALVTRREAEAAAAETERSVARAEHALRTVAAEVGLASDGAPDDVAEALAAWRRGRGAEAERADEARREWHELQTLLDGLPVEQLQADA
ncbi:MAG TPA: AAA family ATPase, partial [Solirubrobacteraceae bacterium]|nr:AAA family ATPase [Solirubrobacteraceae bacterium]